MTEQAGGKDSGDSKDAAESQLPPFIPVIDESDRLTDLMDYWEVTGQERQVESGRENARQVEENPTPPEQRTESGEGEPGTQLQARQEEKGEKDKKAAGKDSKQPEKASKEQELAKESMGEQAKSKEGPSIPPRALENPAPPRPTLGHTGQLPSDAHIQLAEDANAEFGLFEAAR